MIHNSVRITNLIKGYGGEPIFDCANAFIPAGSFVFLTGKSGSGKSTLLKIIHRIEKENSGEVCVGSYTDRTPLSELRRNIGFIFQDYRLLENQTAHENIQLPLYIRGMSGTRIRQRIKTVAKDCDIVHLLKQKVGSLSGGEKQLIALARAAVALPILILADEPTANLDNEAAAKVLYLLEKLHSKGTTTILATHDLALIQAKKALVFLIQNQQLKKAQAI